MLSEEEIRDVLKKDPLIRECAIESEENKICECGHKEKFHHNHGTFVWTEGHCSRCMMCPWDGKDSCYTFTEKT